MPRSQSHVELTTFVLSLAFIAGPAAVTTVAQAPPFEERIKIVADDGGPDDAFGHAVSIDRGVLAIGCPSGDGNVTISGAAYLYDATTGAQLVKLVSVDGDAGDQFGRSIAIADGLVVVGAPQDEHGGVMSGSVYVFDAVSGVQRAKLVAGDAEDGDLFGYAVAIENGLVAVGAMGCDDLGDGSGAAYLFDAGTGVQLGKVLPDRGAANQAFGVSIAMDDGVVAIGSRSFFELGEGFTLGAVRLFDVESGDHLRTLQASNGTWTDFFGEAIALDDGLVAVGAWARSIFFDHSGAAYIFDASTGEQLQYIFPEDGHDRDNFGISIAIDKGVVAIGAHQDGDNGFVSGSAYLFDARSGAQIDKLLASDGVSFDYFGTSIAVERGVVAVGAIGDDDAGDESGSVYVFKHRRTLQSAGPRQ